MKSPKPVNVEVILKLNPDSVPPSIYSPRISFGLPRVRDTKDLDRRISQIIITSNLAVTDRVISLIRR
ncbi:MAG: hypothetical protein WAV41_01490 [Microgenomates group bacterium]